LSRGSRPIGVTVVSILMIANAALLVGGGIFIILVIPGVINEQLAGNQTNITIGSQTIGNVGKTATSLIHAIIIGVSTVSIALGVGAFVLALALLSGKGWSWMISVILAIISVIFSIVALASGGFTSIITLIINGAIAYYLYKPPIKAYFGRVKIPR
jgi:hypothetical protein